MEKKNAINYVQIINSDHTTGYFQTWAVILSLESGCFLKPFAAKSVPLSRKSLAKILIQTSHYSKSWFTIQILTHFSNQ